MQRSANSSSIAWALSDGHAGNVRQAQALAAALGLSTREWILAPRAPWRWAAPRRLPLATRAFGTEFARALAHPPVLAIGCGRQAALATRLLRGAGARSVQILDPRIAPHHWDLVIAPEHDRLHGDNVIAVLGSLNPVDDLWLASARTDNPAIGQLPGPLTTVLVGGASAHATFDDASVEALATGLASLQRRDGGSLLITTSRRTPEAAVARLRALAGAAPGLLWTGAGDGPNPYAALLGWADRIVCTADSVNMLSEACATNVPVFVSGAGQLGGRPRRVVDALLACGRVQPFDEALSPFAVTPLRETMRVAAEVRTRLAL
jgi:mitochondrial fission protein ELM1